MRLPLALPLAALLASCGAAAADAAQLPLCDHQAACYCETIPGGSFNLFCRLPVQFTYRVTYVAPTAASGASLIIWCDPLTMRREHYQLLYSYNMTLGPVEKVVFNLCPLPTGRLVAFFERLGVSGTQRLRVNSHDMLNDTMPADFLHGSNATSVQLNGLTRIDIHDDFLATLGHLQNLTLSGTALTLPSALFQHTPRLGQLGLAGNQLRELPEQLLDGLTQLRLLSLGNNLLRQLSRRHFRDLGQLEMLDLYRNELRELPEDALTSLSRLQSLRLQYNPLQRLPEGLFAGAPSLRLLHLNGGSSSGGNLTTLPAGLFRGLRRLEMLMLDRLNVRQLPAGLFADLKSLTNLTLDNNMLEALPEGVFAGLTALQNLDLRANQLTTLPAGLLREVPRLDTLYLSRNRLAALPDGLFAATPRMERLFLGSNDLSNVSTATFSGLGTSLRLLRLDRNRLAFDRRSPRPPAFQELAELRDLTLAHNRIDHITQDLLVNLVHLRRLDLRRNLLHRLTFDDLNFLCNEAEIDLRSNNISTISFPLATMKVDGNDHRKPNAINVNDNPLLCDCQLLSLRAYLDGTGTFARRAELDELFQLVTDARPAGAALPTRLPRVRRFGVSLHLEGTALQRLTNLSATTAPVTELHLSGNNLTTVEPSALPPALRLLRLDHNHLSTVSPQLVAYLERSGVRVALGANPFVCDCAMLPLHRLMQRLVSNGSRQVLDASDVFCVGHNSSLLALKPEEVCPWRQATLIAVCVAATALAMCLLVIAVLYYHYSDTIKVWLYAHNLCMRFVTEEELDTDKKYDAFVSYSHLDEEFVVEHLVPQLEQGEPKYSLCLHFRDWLAGEWITDQIQQSVQSSRRVIVVMSQNFLRSEWGRLEFLTAHKQALNEKRNRLIVLVYGELPDPAAMDPELRLYISSNTYLKWGDALFWERLRYALPHKGRRLRRRRGRRRLTSDKLGLIIRENGLSSAGSTPTTEMPATPGGGGHANGCFVGDKLAPIVESIQREQFGDHVV
ncbi:LOW QUALITY PROTEIN: protein toll-like [Pollicipes pollicipes]|uniref:LOW QUALITY PROTEIN: protein toll-like n=1 Tax=Pollicipes pollicipes TaxID=41117 RepID=UPI0018856147|nr:LOW QUALITY PROTEIN: protein toll-like [Pollicipes pollicipes]